MQELLRGLDTANRLFINKLISLGCVHIACDILLTTGLLQAVNTFVASSILAKRVIHKLVACGREDKAGAN